MLMMINGQLTDQISALDRGLNYGDGCFTTALVNQKKVFYFDHHLARLHHDCERLHFPNISWDNLENTLLTEANTLIAQTDASPLNKKAVLKIILTRGEGSRGYSPQGANSITRILTLTPYPDIYHSWQKTGIDLGVSPVRLAHQPLLAGIKHLNRLEQILIKRELSQTLYQDVIVLDQNDKIVEASASNLFWRKGDTIYTPDVSQAGINGLMRNRIINLLEKSGFCVVKIVKEPVQSLQSAEEIMLSNALMPLIPVKKIYPCSSQYWEYSPLKREAWPYLFSLLESGK